MQNKVIANLAVASRVAVGAIQLTVFVGGNVAHFTKEIASTAWDRFVFKKLMRRKRAGHRGLEDRHATDAA